MKRSFILIAVIVAFVGVPAVFAGGAQEAPATPFAEQLESALTEEGFSEAEAQEIAAAARELFRDSAEDADPEIVARALAAAEQEGIELNSEQNAELALELAQNAVRLQEEEGYEQSVVAKAALEAVRTMQQEIEEWKSGDGSENLGEIVRNRVSTAARNAARKQAEAQKGSADKGSAAAADTPGGDKAGSGSSVD
jgi:uncharacterized lipoprotein NlpE involved in copper resistance